MVKKCKYLKFLFRHQKNEKNVSKETEKLSAEITYERQKIETHIGLVKKRFQILNQKYRRGTKPLFDYVLIACAVHNYTIKKINNFRRLYQ